MRAALIPIVAVGFAGCGASISYVTHFPQQIVYHVQFANWEKAGTLYEFD